MNKQKLKAGDKVYVHVRFSHYPKIENGVGVVDSVYYDGHYDMHWVNIKGIDDASFHIENLLADQAKLEHFYTNL